MRKFPASLKFQPSLLPNWVALYSLLPKVNDQSCLQCKIKPKTPYQQSLLVSMGKKRKKHMKILSQQL